VKTHHHPGHLASTRSALSYPPSAVATPQTAGAILGLPYNYGYTHACAYGYAHGYNYDSADEYTYDPADSTTTLPGTVHTVIPIKYSYESPALPRQINKPGNSPTTTTAHRRPSHRPLADTDPGSSTRPAYAYAAAPCPHASAGHGTLVRDRGYDYAIPAVSLWPSRDPIGEKGGVNLYGFVRNDGIGKWDRLGLYCVQTSFRWTTYPRIKHFSLEWDTNGATKLETITAHWEGEAEVECCCGTWFWRYHPKRTGTLVGESIEKPYEILLSPAIPLPLDIPIPGNITEGIFELVTKALEENLGKVPAGNKAEVEEADLNIRGYTEKLASEEPPTMVWKGGKAPCE